MSGLKIDKAYSDLHIHSRGRKRSEFAWKSMNSGLYLFIDGKKICKMTKGAVYLFHMLGGKIDHFEKIPPADLKFWNFQEWLEEDPSEWCDGCIEEDDIPFFDDDYIPF